MKQLKSFISVSQEILEAFDSEINFITNKLHYRKSKKDIARWLDNFSEEDRISALEILKRFKYVSEEELFASADSIVKEIDSDISPEYKIYFYPIAKYGKSATLMSYYFQKSSTFKTLEQSGRAKFMVNEYQIRNLSFDEKSALVFFDDFFGSGKSFLTYYNYVSTISDLTFTSVPNVYAASLYYMEQAEVTIKNSIKGIKLIGDLHPKIFGEVPLMFYTNTLRLLYKNLATEYSGKKKLFFDKSRIHYLGYEESEALITFPYVPPNNTLPIIWSGKSNWYALFPRMEDDIFDSLKRYKEQLLVAAAKLDFGLPDDFDGFQGITKTRFVVFGLLRMLKQKIVVPQIAALMGVGIGEIEKFVELSIRMGFLNKELELTEKGLNALNEIQLVIKNYKQQLSDRHPDVKIKNIEYVPQKISGK